MHIFCKTVLLCKTCFYDGDHISKKKGWITSIQWKKTVSRDSIKLQAPIPVCNKI